MAHAFIGPVLRQQQLRQAVLQLAPRLAPATLALFDTPATEMEVDLALQFETEFPGRSVALRRRPAAPVADAVQQRLDGLWSKVQSCIGQRAEVCQNQASVEGGLEQFYPDWK